MKHMYESRDRAYFSRARREIAPLLPATGSRMLELGCGEGATLGWLKESRRFDECWGIELMEPAARVARGIFDHVIVTDIEAGGVQFDDGRFDLILCLDVLEHLKDPWTVMARLGHWLAAGGALIASVPNIRYYGIVRDLALNGTFQYGDFGILDRTHLRFFTKKSAIELMRAGGLDDIRILLHPDTLKGKHWLIDRATFGAFRDTFSWQLLLSGQKSQSV